MPATPPQPAGYSAFEYSQMKELPKYDRQIREALKKFDFDASGGLRLDDLASVLVQPEAYAKTSFTNKKDVAAFLKKFDTNRDGVLDFGEFMNGWRSTMGVDADQQLLDALRAASTNKPFNMMTHYATSESAITGKITGLKDPN